MNYTFATTNPSYRCAQAYKHLAVFVSSPRRTYYQLSRTVLPTQSRPFVLWMTGLTSRQGRTHTTTMPLFRRDMSINTKTRRKAYIALGSNVGDRLEMIEKACLALDQDPDINVTRTSSLYETEPMYVQDQARFLNGACEVGTLFRAVPRSYLLKFDDRWKPH